MDQRTGDQKSHYGFSALEKEEVWERWARGESLKAIGAKSSLIIGALAWQPISMSISAIRKALGSAARTRTPMVSYDSTFRKERTYPCIRRRT